MPTSARHALKKSAFSIVDGPILRNICLFSVPLIFTNMLQVLFNMVDIAVVGQFAGARALGAVGSTPNLLFLFGGLLIGIGGGVNALVAYFIGARDKKSLSETIHTAAIFCFFFGVLLLLIGTVFGREILLAMNTKADLLDGAALYFRIYMCGMPAVALYNFGNAIFSASGNTERPLYFLAISGIANVILDLIFVILLRLDVAGVALATVIAQYISALLVIISLLREKSDIRLSLPKLRIEKSKLVRLASVGLPSGFQNMIFAFANVFVQIGVNSFDSVMVAGNSASANVDPLIYNIMAAIYVACATFIAQNYGAGQRGRVRKSYLAATFLSFGIAFVLGALLFVFSRQVMSLFTSDKDVIECALHRVRIMAFSYCVSAFMDCTIAACRGLGKTLVPSIFVFLGSCVFRIAWILTVFARFGTIESLFLLYVFSWGITAIFEIAYFVRIYRKSFSNFA